MKKGFKVRKRGLESGAKNSAIMNGPRSSRTRLWTPTACQSISPSPGEAHNNRLCSVLLSALLPQTMLLADRGYDADCIRELVRHQGAWANIPPKRNGKTP